MLIILDDSIMIAKLPRRSGTDELLITGHGRSISISGTISTACLARSGRHVFVCYLLKNSIKIHELVHNAQNFMFDYS